METLKHVLLLLAAVCVLTACGTTPTTTVTDTAATDPPASTPDLSEAGLDPRPLEEVEAVSGFDCPLSSNLEEAFDQELVNTTRPPDADTTGHAPFGVPVPTATVDNEVLLHHKEYLVQYDSDLKVPVWVAYTLEKKQLVARPRTNCFRADPRLTDVQNAQLEDYIEPVFDRGHMVPRADMNRSEAAMLNTFVLTNMSPQHDTFNQGAWGQLETQVRELVFEKKSAHVVTGAVFDRDGDGQRDADSAAERMAPFNRVAVPTHFYKVVLHQREDGFIESLAVLLPHEDLSRNKAEQLQWLNDHRVSIDTIEAVAGYDLFSGLADPVEAAVEAVVSDHVFD